MLDAVRIAGLAAAAILAAALIWSIVWPARRMWPPRRFSMLLAIVVWVLILAIYSSSFVLGIADWGAWRLPVGLRAFGGVIAVLGGVVLWSQVVRLGVGRTSGKAGGLETGGLYRFSRHPQDAADIAILVGWTLLSAAPAAVPVAAAGVVVLLLAPYAEEPWLRERYGAAHDAYRARVPRFF